MPLPELVGKLGLDVTGWQRSIGTALSDTDSFTSKLSGKLTGIGGLLTGTLTAGITGIGALALSAGNTFDDAMDTIRTATGATGTALSGLETSFSNVFKSVPSSAADAATAIGLLSSKLDLTGEPLTNLATQLLNLSRITGESLEPLISSTTRVFGDWSIATDKQAGALDFLFRTSQSTGTSISTLQDNVVKFGAPLRQMGFDFETSAALLGKFEREGVNTELVMGSLRIALTRMAKEGVTDASAGLQSIITDIKAAGSSGEANALALKTFGSRAGPDMAAAIREGRFELGGLVSDLTQSKESINTAAADTAGFAEKWTLFKNNLTAALEPLGTKLLSALDGLLTRSKPFLDMLAGAVDWFGKLPDPVQNFGIALGAISAAIGPVLLAVGSMIGPITSLLGLFGGTAGITAAITTAGTAIATFGGSLAAVLTAPVGLAVAAVAALGTAAYLIYDNWTEVKATLTGLWTDIVNLGIAAWTGLKTFFVDLFPADFFTGVWEGIKTSLSVIWTSIAGAGESIWRPVINFFSTMWDGISGSFKLVWDGLSDHLKGVWESIKGFANSIWDGITNKINSALKALEILMPETAKALRDWGKDVKDAEQNTKDLAGETKTLKDGIKKLKPEVDNAGMSVGKLTGKVKAQKDEIKKLDTQQLAYLGKLTDLKTKLAEATGRYEDFTEAVSDGRAGTEALALSDKLAQITAETLDIKRLAVPVFTTDLTPALSGALAQGNALKDALHTLGISGKDDLQKVAQEAAVARDAVLGSNLATDFEKKTAVYKALQAQVAAAKQAGLDIPADQAAMLAKMKTDLESTSTGVPALKTPWTNFGTEVSTIFTNFTQSIGKSLFDGDLSFGEKAKAMLKSLGEAATNLFVKPFTDALSSLMSGVITDLLGGKGLGGIADKLGSLGGLFGGGGGGGAPKIPTGGVPGVPGGGGGAGGVASAGFASTLNMVTGLGTLASSIFGNFQSAAMNKSLDILVSLNLGILNQLVYGIQPQINEYLPSLSHIHQRLIEMRDVDFPAISDSLRGFDKEGNAVGLFDRMTTGFGELTGAIMPAMSQIRENTAEMAAGSARATGAPINIHFHGPVIGTREFAAVMAEEMGNRLKEAGYKI